MKEYMKIFPQALLAALIILIASADVYAQQTDQPTKRDHRVMTVDSAKTTVRDHRTPSRQNTTVTAKRGSKARPQAAKHYQLNAAGKFVPFNPPSADKNGTVAKSAVNCAIIPCPPEFKDGITCWKCVKSEDTAAPDAKKAKKNR